MPALFVVVAIAVVGVVAVLVVRDRPLIEDDPVGARTLAWPGVDAVTPQALTDVRFALALRGYRMEEVDRVLDDTRAALAGRDARLAELERVVDTLRGGRLQQPSGVPEVDSALGAPTGPAEAPSAPGGAQTRP